MRIRRSSSFWPGELGKMIDQFKTGDIVAFLGSNSATFHGTVLDVNAAINKVLVAWNGGGVEQHDPDEVTLHPAYAARVASRRSSGETLITENSEEAEKDEDFVGDAKEHGLDTPIGGGFNIMQDLTKKLHKESIRDASSLIGRRAMYWTGPDRTFRMTKKEQESGDACCPTCKSHMDKESFTRGENLYRCSECNFKVPSSKIVTRRVEKPVEPVEPVEVFPQSPLRSVRDYVGSDDLRTRRSKKKGEVPEAFKKQWKKNDKGKKDDSDDKGDKKKDDGKMPKELLEKFKKKKKSSAKTIAKKKGEVPEAFKKQWKNKDKDGDGKENEPKPDFVKEIEKKKKNKKAGRRGKMTAEDYEILESFLDKAVAKAGKSTLKEHREKLESDTRVRDADERFRWDLLNASKIKIGDGKGMSGDVPLYGYMNDNQIDTALKFYVDSKRLTASSAETIAKKEVPEAFKKQWKKNDKGKKDDSDDKGGKKKDDGKMPKELLEKFKKKKKAESLIAIKKYKLGDKWSEDFDYDGMLEWGMKANLRMGERKLKQLYDSYEDVNYHGAAIPLFIALQELQDGNESSAKNHLKAFNKESYKML